MPTMLLSQIALVTSPYALSRAQQQVILRIDPQCAAKCRNICRLGGRLCGSSFSVAPSRESTLSAKFGHGASPYQASGGLYPVLVWLACFIAASAS